MTAESSATGSAFNQYYFEHCCGRPYGRDEHWLKFFGIVADEIVARIRPARVLDAGCAFGMLVEGLHARGVHAEGIDISEYAISQAAPAVKANCRVGSIAEEFPDRYDLIVCIEVVEHMPQADAERAIANFCRHSDDILFSSTPGDYREPTHVNVHPPEHWAELFARQGFFRDVDFDASFITAWAVRYRRRTDPPARLVRDYERRFAEVAAEAAERRQYARELQHQIEVQQNRIGVLEREREAILADRQQLEERRVTEREQVQEELRVTRDALQHTHQEVSRAVVEIEELRAQAVEFRAESDSRSHQLTHARETIRMMERSIFWKLRKWLRGR